MPVTKIGEIQVELFFDYDPATTAALPVPAAAATAELICWCRRAR
jgi:hypothetical protein